jgi:transcriptional regulator with GAF, ATPase, and Fis domain
MAILSEATRKALWEFLPDGLKQSSEEAAHEKNQVLSERVDNFAREEIIRTLNETGWNKSAAARQLGMPEGTLRSKMKKLKIYPLKLVS